MRFNRGEGPSRRSVTIEVQGRRMAVASRHGGGPEDIREKVFDTPDEAQLAADRLVRELIGRGYLEADGPDASPDDPYDLAEPAETSPALPPLHRSSSPEAATASPKKPRRRRTRRGEGDGGILKDLAGPALAALAGLGMIGVLIWVVTRPPSLVGTWRSTRGFAFTEGSLIGPTRVYTFGRDGSVTMILEDEHLFLDGTFEREDGRLRLRFDRGNSWELGDFDLSDSPMELEFSIDFKGGWLVLLDEDGGETQLMKMRDGGVSRIGRGGPGRDGPDDGDEPPVDPGPDPLRGRWVVTSFERDGAPGIDGPSWIAFDGSSATFARRSADGRETTTSVPFSVNIDHKPQWIDLLDGDAPRLGYFAVTGDVLTLVLNDLPGGDRPAPFADDIQANRLRIVLHRDPPPTVEDGSGGKVGGP